MQATWMRKIKSLGIIVVAVFAFNPAIAAGAPVVEGVDYTILKVSVPVAKEANGKVNVKEFFSFGCPHCRVVDPLVENILVPNKKIDLNRIQVVWDPVTTGYAKLNATIQMMNMGQLYASVFQEILKEQTIAGIENPPDMNNQTKLKNFLLQTGLSKDQTNKFLTTYNSFAVNTKVAEYGKMLTTYNITSTPTFVVADKYVVNPAQPARLIEVVQNLVGKAAANK